MSEVNAGVFPAGSFPPVATLPEGVNVFTIIRVESSDPRSYYYVQFPDGFIKTLHCNTTEELTAQISGLLRGRYGVETITYTKIPQTAVEGETIEITI